MQKWKCENPDCRWTGTEPPIDSDDEPFCPRCGGEEMDMVCHILGCKRSATCGDKCEDGVYRWACHEHRVSRHRRG